MNRLVARTRFVLLSLFVVLVSAFLAGEVFLRIVFWDGASFANHSGPIVSQFERNVQVSHFDGSRGPEMEGAKGTGIARVLVQGDSVTWGQGIRDENQLFTTKLLSKLHHRDPCVEMTVLARPGREIDDHVVQLSKYGPELQPDFIVYQWCPNDLEIHTKGNRPHTTRLWRVPYVHEVLRRSSYLWYYLDFRLDSMLPGPAQSYSDYLLEYFAHDTPAWREFASTFRQWAALAKSYTPRVVVVLYPEEMDDSAPYHLESLHTKVVNLAQEQGLDTVDLADVLRPYKGNKADFVSPMDPHPSPLIHAVIAQSLYDTLVKKWGPLLKTDGFGGGCRVDPLPAIDSENSEPASNGEGKHT